MLFCLNHGHSGHKQKADVYGYSYPRGPTLQKIVYKISKSFDFIEITLIFGDFTDFIEITLIVKSRKCLHTTSANSDIFATCSCHVRLHKCSREDV